MRSRVSAPLPEDRVTPRTVSRTVSRIVVASGMPAHYYLS